MVSILQENCVRKIVDRCKNFPDDSLSSIRRYLRRTLPLIENLPLPGQESEPDRQKQDDDFYDAVKSKSKFLLCSVGPYLLVH